MKNSNEPRKRRQFSLLAMLAAMGLVATFFGLFSWGLYLAAYWYVVACSLLMMARDVVLGRTSRLWSVGLIVFAVAYACVNAGIFHFTMRHDATAIFDLSYIVGHVLVAPGLVILASIIVAAVTRRLAGLSVLGFAIWIGCVAFAHLWAIGECSKSV